MKLRFQWPVRVERAPRRTAEWYRIDAAQRGFERERVLIAGKAIPSGSTTMWKLSGPSMNDHELRESGPVESALAARGMKQCACGNAGSNGAQGWGTLEHAEGCDGVLR